MPFPRPSMAPEVVTETAETRKPGEKVHKLCGGQETDDGSKKHDHTAGFQCQPENFFHTFHFPGTEVVADQRTHSLNDTIGRKIQEGL